LYSLAYLLIDPFVILHQILGKKNLSSSYAWDVSSTLQCFGPRYWDLPFTSNFFARSGKIFIEGDLGLYKTV